MLKPVEFTERQVGAPAPAVGLSLAKKVFKVFHASYGNLFLSKFQTGQMVKVLVNGVQQDTGRDKGVETAMEVWSAGLARFAEPVVVAALERCDERYPDFPPTRAQFLALCRACQPAEVYKPDALALPMDAKLRSAYAARAREINQRHAEKSAALKAETIAAAEAPGLGGLFAAIANAAACGGEDEAVALRRLETSMAARPVAGETAA